MTIRYVEVTTIVHNGINQAFFDCHCIANSQSVSIPAEKSVEKNIRPRDGSALNAFMFEIQKKGLKDSANSALLNTDPTLVALMTMSGS